MLSQNCQQRMKLFALVSLGIFDHRFQIRNITCGNLGSCERGYCSVLLFSLRLFQHTDYRSTHRFIICSCPGSILIVTSRCWVIFVGTTAASAIMSLGSPKSYISDSKELARDVSDRQSVHKLTIDSPFDKQIVLPIIFRHIPSMNVVFFQKSSYQQCLRCESILNIVSPLLRRKDRFKLSM